MKAYKMASKNTIKLVAIILGLAGIWITTVAILLIGGIIYFWILFASFGISIAFISVLMPSDEIDPALAIECVKKGQFALPNGSGCSALPEYKKK
jgi:hypothetical protein